MPRSQNLDLTFRPWRQPSDGQRHRSLWLNEALADEDPSAPRRLEGDLDTDVAVVGGGFTGLWTAIRLRLQEPDVRVTIVEADLCGSGASGRNSGGIGHWWGKLPTLVRLLGPNDAVTLLKASVQAVEDIAAFAAEQGIVCDLRRSPSVWTATAPAQVGAWGGVIRTAEKLGLEAPLKPVADADLKRMFGRGPYFGGVMETDVTRAQPARLARGLRRVAIDVGVDIREASPVQRLRGTARGLTVETDRGRLNAGQVVLAANAWMAHLPEFRPYVMVLSSDIVYTDPIPGVLKRHGLDQRPGGHNSRMMLNYGGVTPEGRVYLGRGGGHDRL